MAAHRKYPKDMPRRAKSKATRLAQRDAQEKKLGRPPIFSDEVIHDYASKLIHWAYTTEKPLLSDFCVEFRIPRSRFDEWTEKNIIFHRAYLEARDVMIAKMYSAVAENRFSFPLFNKIGHHIDARLRKDSLQDVYDKAYHDAKGKADAVGLDNAKEMIFKTNSPREEYLAKKE